LAVRPKSERWIHPDGDVRKTAELLLDKKVSVLRKDELNNKTCYHHAAENGIYELVEVLAERGAKLNMTDNSGNTGIHIACYYVKKALSKPERKMESLERAKVRYEETLERLKGRDMTDEQIAEYIENNMSETPESLQKEYEAAVALIEGYFRVVKAFVAGGVDIDEKNNSGVSALDNAVESNAKKIAAYLSGAPEDDNSIAAGGMTLHQATLKGDVEAIKAIVASGADLNAPDGAGKGYSPLAIAVSRVDVDAVEALLACGADPSFKDNEGRVAIAQLFLESLGNTCNLRLALSEKHFSKIFKDMFSAGLTVNISVNEEEDTMLTLLCKRQPRAKFSINGANYSLFHVFLDEIMRRNPDINVTNRFGETALMFVCAADFKEMESIQLDLLEQGADVSVSDQKGNTALHYAARNNNNNGAKTLCDMLIEFGADANAVNNNGETALDIATQKDNEPLVKLLLSKM
jgi:ankyrin repeat protein